MKTIFTLFASVLLTALLMAQAPDAINYQSVARDNSGNILSNQVVSLRLSILQGSSSGSIVYSEIHQKMTNQFGLLDLKIGTGIVLLGNLSTIDWENYSYYLRTEMDGTGGTNYQSMGISQFLSVPYALHSKNGIPNGQNEGDMLYWNGSDWLEVPAGTTGQVLTMNGSIPNWSYPAPRLPSLLTEIDTVFATHAFVKGFPSDGGSVILSKGLCWGINPNPTILNNTSYGGAGTNNFVNDVVGLNAATTYYVRAYATNYIGTGYGDERNFTTQNGNILLTTNTVTNILISSATSGGNVIFDGGDPVTTRGICWSTSPNPTTADYHTANGVGTGTFTSNLSGLTLNTLYYVRGYATNSVGTFYGNQIIFTSASHYIGETFGGGIIFYIDSVGQHGLISAISDQGSTPQWGCYGILIGTTPSIGTGQTNTTAIINTCNAIGVAAQVCDNLDLNGFSDWFLPSKDELNQMYLRKSLLGMSVTKAYWCSTEYSQNPNNQACTQFFYNGFQGFMDKNSTELVRPIRAF